MSVGLLKKCFEYISREVYENPGMSEDELYSVLDRSRFFEYLGYEKVGVEIRKQFVIVGERKKADYVCLDDYQNVIFVIEAKKPREEKLRDALGQLWERYVLPLRARYGVLTNGRRFMVYKRVLGGHELAINVKLEKVSQTNCDEIFGLLRKPEYEITFLPRVKKYFESVETLSLKEPLAKEYFFETFKLNVDSVFGVLIKDLLELFDWVYPRSKFLKGAYGFWRRSLAREPEKVPGSWRPFLKDDKDVFKFMFCLETAHALLARLILAKACEDLDFPGINVSNFTLQKIHQVRGQIPLIAYPVVLVRLIKEMRDQLVYSVFEEDIFGWWTDAFKESMGKSSSELLQESVDKPLEDFSEATAKVILMLYKFDFGEVAGDPLGDLYQQYFDKDTRKALGEFYTPIEVVNYILDAVGYENIGYKRLLDPACGSGTFIVEALKRYLREAKGKAKKHGWAYVVRELCASPKIVGFDIHPFACLIARTRFMLELIPYFKKALEEEAPRMFYLQRIPIFRTDSLAIEMLPPEFQTQRQLAETKEDIAFPVTVPMKIDSENSLSVKIILPSWRKILSHSLPLYNLDEYFCTLQATFDVVKNLLSVGGELVPETSLEAHLKEYLRDKNFTSLANFFKPYADNVLREIKRVQSEFEDGRLIKSIEDAVLASLLKNYLQYDFVVGNPPYVRTVAWYSPTLAEYYRRNYESAYWNFDLYVLFVERGLNSLKDNGNLGFICSNQFIKRRYGKGLRAFILNKCRLQHIVDFGDSGVFEDVTNYPCIIVLERKSSKNAIKCVRVFAQKEHILGDIKDHIHLERYVNTSYEIFQFDQNNLDEGIWSLVPSDEKKILEIMENRKSSDLRDVCDVVSGLRIGRDALFIIKKVSEIDEKDLEVIPAAYSKTGTKFLVEGSLLKPILKGADVRRWRCSWKQLYVIYPHKKEGEKTIAIPEDEMQANYPHTHTYFSKHKEILDERIWFGKTATDLHGEWYAIMYPDSAEVFQNVKILTPALTNKTNFAFNEKGYFFVGGTAGVLGIIPKEINAAFLMGLLNSKLFDFYLRHKTPVKAGGYYQCSADILKVLPIKIPERPEEKEISNSIVQNVEKILEQSRTERLIEHFPEPYLGEYRSTGVEFDEIKYPFHADHSKLKPFLSGLPGKGYVIYPSKGEGSIWVDTKEKARYLALTLRNKKVKQNETIKILVPRDNSIVTEILERVEKTVQELKATSIDELEEETNKLVYQLYGLNEDDKAVLEDFLKKF